MDGVQLNERHRGMCTVLYRGLPVWRPGGRAVGATGGDP